ncbi:MAG: hypothetical protein KBC42_03250 [Candidatus Pacebacteria bacterium]|nr:hypothetical protein [Candidatus Paceibacterota bacterium]MBP9780913.1 hypothetical protein [Candidatus Paceibacterota bacterium]
MYTTDQIRAMAQSENDGKKRAMLLTLKGKSERVELANMAFMVEKTSGKVIPNDKNQPAFQVEDILEISFKE